MTKRLLSLFLAGAMVFSLAACGGSGDSGNGGTSDTKAPSIEAGDDGAGAGDEGGAGAAELDVENVEDLYVTWPSLGGAPADLGMIEEAVNEIVTLKLGVNVVLQSIPLSDLTSQQQLLISSGEKADIVSILWTGLDVWVNTESLLEIEDYLPTYGSGIVDLLGEKAYAGSRNGHVYGLSTVYGGAPFGFFARKDILEKYGYDTEDHTVTVEELEEIFATVKEGEGDGFYPVAGGGSFQCVGTSYDMLGGAAYSGVLMFEKDPNTIVDLYETDEFAEYAQRMYDWAQKGWISADAATTEDTPQTLIATGNYLGACSPLSQATKNSYGSNGMVPLTSLEIIPGATTIDDLTSVMWGISSTCEIPEKAVAFVNELYTNAELANLLSLGIEGVHYEVVEENEKGQKLVAMAEGLDPMTSGYYVFLGVWATGSNAVFQIEGAGYQELDDKELSNGYELSPAFGYVFDNSDYQTELTALSAVYNEYYKIIDCGAIDPATELPALINALKAANVDDVVAANQAQYEAWQAAQ